MNLKNKWIKLGFGLLWVCFAATACRRTQEATRPLVIGVQPNEREKDLESFRQQLGSRLGVPVSVFVPKDYAELLEAFSKAQVDFAFFSPVMFLNASRGPGQAKALLKKLYGKDEFYYSAWVTLRDSKVKDLKSLEGFRVGFVDRKSTSGYLYPRALLRRSGFDAGDDPRKDLKEIPAQYFGTHKDSIRALLRKEVDLVGVWSDDPKMGTGAWSDPEFEKTGSKFRVLGVSDPIPNDAFAVRETFYTENPMLVFRMMESLIGMSEGPKEDQVLKKVFDIDGLVTATSRHYDSVKELQELVGKP